MNDTLNLQIKNLEPQILNHLGTVQDVLNAELPFELRQKRFDARNFKYGFELATPNKIDSLGESIMVGGYCYTSSTEKNSNKLIYGHKFTAGGVFIVPNNLEPNIVIQGLKNSDSIHILDFYDKLYHQVNLPLGFAALIKFEEFYGNAICKAPINHHSIFEYQDEFYTKDEVHLKNVYGVVIGAFTNFSNKNCNKINSELESILYKNPFDITINLTHHAHVLILNQNPGSLHNVKPHHGDHVFHLLAKQTKIKSIQGEVYVIGSVKKFKGEINHE